MTTNRPVKYTQEVILSMTYDEKLEAMPYIVAEKIYRPCLDVPKFCKCTSCREEPYGCWRRIALVDSYRNEYEAQMDYIEAKKKNVNYMRHFMDRFMTKEVGKSNV